MTTTLYFWFLNHIALTPFGTAVAYCWSRLWPVFLIPMGLVLSLGILSYCYYLLGVGHPHYLTTAPNGTTITMSQKRLESFNNRISALLTKYRQSSASRFCDKNSPEG